VAGDGVSPKGWMAITVGLPATKPTEELIRRCLDTAATACEGLVMRQALLTSHTKPFRKGSAMIIQAPTAPGSQKGTWDGLGNAAGAPGAEAARLTARRISQAAAANKRTLLSTAAAVASSGGKEGAAFSR